MDFPPHAFPPLPPPPGSQGQHSQTHGHHPRLGKSTSSLLASNLASNLASKRGIPTGMGMHGAHGGGQVLSPVVSSATGRRGDVGYAREALGGQGQGPHYSVTPTSNPLLVMPPDRHPQGGQRRERGAGAQKQDQAFGRFYTSLESFVSRIGSPLAGPLGFAGMDIMGEGGDGKVTDSKKLQKNTEKEKDKEVDKAEKGKDRSKGVDAGLVVVDKDTPVDLGPAPELIDGSTVSAATSDKDGYPYGYGVADLVQNLMPKAWWSGQEEATKSMGKAGGRGIFGGGGGTRGVRGRLGNTGWQGNVNESYYVGSAFPHFFI